MGYARPAGNVKISDTFQGHRNRKPASTEPGTDYGCAYGTTLVAAGDGVVVDVQTTTAGADGRRVTIDLYDGRRVSYIHLSVALVRVGQTVTRGQAVARSGASANGKEWGVGAHVHTTLWAKHAYTWGRDATLDFELFVGDAVAIAFQQVVADRQNFLNVAQGEKLVVDGRFGDFTKAAIQRYQTYLKGRGWYSGDIDGDWGPATQAAHDKRYAEWAAPHAAPAPQFHNATVDDIASLPNKRGLQKVADLYLGRNEKTGLDNDWGPRSRKGLQAFLNQNYGGSLVAWLRAKWGYVGNEQWGPVMAAAATRADTANWRAL
ncbi:M23 family metallopeptidase [Microbacterium sp. LMI12-1-1.1]|uniref:M23 family metallopeptidase n=1 Tax=Microbacterium sp. LMI12-1-1.1 TaxID=3135225 RepID=UPI003425D5D1